MIITKSIVIPVAVESRFHAFIYLAVTIIVFTMVKSSGAITVYVNGVAVMNHVLPANFNIRYAAPHVTLGRLASSEARNWNGSLDEIRMWNRPLCPAEIQHYMNKELPYSSGNGLIAYYKANSGNINSDNTSQTTRHNYYLFRLRRFR